MAADEDSSAPMDTEEPTTAADEPAADGKGGEGEGEAGAAAPKKAKTKSRRRNRYRLRYNLHKSVYVDIPAVVEGSSAYLRGRLPHPVTRAQPAGCGPCYSMSAMAREWLAAYVYGCDTGELPDKSAIEHDKRSQPAQEKQDIAKFLATASVRNAEFTAAEVEKIRTKLTGLRKEFLVHLSLEGVQSVAKAQCTGEEGQYMLAVKWGTTPEAWDKWKEAHGRAAAATDGQRKQKKRGQRGKQKAMILAQEWTRADLEAIVAGEKKGTYVDGRPEGQRKFDDFIWSGHRKLIEQKVSAAEARAREALGKKTGEELRAEREALQEERGELPPLASMIVDIKYTAGDDVAKEQFPESFHPAFEAIVGGGKGDVEAFHISAEEAIALRTGCQMVLYRKQPAEGTLVKTSKTKRNKDKKKPKKKKHNRNERKRQAKKASREGADQAESAAEPREHSSEEKEAEGTSHSQPSAAEEKSSSAPPARAESPAAEEKTSSASGGAGDGYHKFRLTSDQCSPKQFQKKFVDGFDPDRPVLLLMGGGGYRQSLFKTKRSFLVGYQLDKGQAAPQLAEEDNAALVQHVYGPGPCNFLPPRALWAGVLVPIIVCFAVHYDLQAALRNELANGLPDPVRFGLHYHPFNADDGLGGWRAISPQQALNARDSASVPPLEDGAEPRMDDPVSECMRQLRPFVPRTLADLRRLATSPQEASAEPGVELPATTPAIASTSTTADTTTTTTTTTTAATSAASSASAESPQPGLVPAATTTTTTTTAASSVSAESPGPLSLAEAGGLQPDGSGWERAGSGSSWQAPLPQARDNDAYTAMLEANVSGSLSPEQNPGDWMLLLRDMEQLARRYGVGRVRDALLTMEAEHRSEYGSATDLSSALGEFPPEPLLDGFGSDSWCGLNTASLDDVDPASVSSSMCLPPEPASKPALARQDCLAAEPEEDRPPEPEPEQQPEAHAGGAAAGEHAQPMRCTAACQFGHTYADGQQVLQCSRCPEPDNWYHRECAGVAERLYEELAQRPEEPWWCPSCVQVVEQHQRERPLASPARQEHLQQVKERRQARLQRATVKEAMAEVAKSEPQLLLKAMQQSEAGREMLELAVAKGVDGFVESTNRQRKAAEVDGYNMQAARELVRRLRHRLSHQAQKSQRDGVIQREHMYVENLGAGEHAPAMKRVSTGRGKDEAGLEYSSPAAATLTAMPDARRFIEDHFLPGLAMDNVEIRWETPDVPDEQKLDGRANQPIELSMCFNDVSLPIQDLVGNMMQNEHGRGNCRPHFSHFEGVRMQLAGSCEATGSGQAKVHGSEVPEELRLLKVQDVRYDRSRDWLSVSIDDVVLLSVYGDGAEYDHVRKGYENITTIVIRAHLYERTLKEAAHTCLVVAMACRTETNITYKAFAGLQCDKLFALEGQPLQVHLRRRKMTVVFQKGVHWIPDCDRKFLENNLYRCVAAGGLFSEVRIVVHQRGSGEVLYLNKPAMVARFLPRRTVYSFQEEYNACVEEAKTPGEGEGGEWVFRHTHTVDAAIGVAKVNKRLAEMTIEPIPLEPEEARGLSPEEAERLALAKGADKLAGEIARQLEQPWKNTMPAFGMPRADRTQITPLHLALSIGKRVGAVAIDACARQLLQNDLVELRAVAVKHRVHAVAHAIKQYWSDKRLTGEKRSLPPGGARKRRRSGPPLQKPAKKVTIKMSGTGEQTFAMVQALTKGQADGGLLLAMVRLRRVELSPVQQLLVAHVIDNAMHWRWVLSFLHAELPLLGREERLGGKVLRLQDASDIKYTLTLLLGGERQLQAYYVRTQLVILPKLVPEVIHYFPMMGLRLHDDNPGEHDQALMKLFNRNGKDTHLSCMMPLFNLLYQCELIFGMASVTQNPSAHRRKRWDALHEEWETTFLPELEQLYPDLGRMLRDYRSTTKKLDAQGRWTGELELVGAVKAVFESSEKDAAGHSTALNALSDLEPIIELDNAPVDTPLASEDQEELAARGPDPPLSAGEDHQHERCHGQPEPVATAPVEDNPPRPAADDPMGVALEQGEPQPKRRRLEAAAPVAARARAAAAARSERKRRSGRPGKAPKKKKRRTGAGGAMDQFA